MPERISWSSEQVSWEPEERNDVSSVRFAGACLSHHLLESQFGVRLVNLRQGVLVISQQVVNLRGSIDHRNHEPDKQNGSLLADLALLLLGCFLLPC